MLSWFDRWTVRTALVGFVVVAGAFEIAFGGARASVFAFLTGVLLCPLVAKLDETRRNGNHRE